MEQILEFMTNHPILWSSLAAMVVLYVWNDSKLAGSLVAPAELGLLMSRSNAVVLDVRDKAEYSKGAIAGAQHVPFPQMKEKLPALNLGTDTALVMVCKMGTTSGAAAKIARSLGFTDIKRLEGGMEGWRREGMPVVKDSPETGADNGETRSRSKKKRNKKAKKTEA